MMMEFALYKEGRCADLLTEDESFEGVKKIADTVASDIELVCGIRPRRIPTADDCGEAVILAATAGKSRLLEQLEEKQIIDLSDVRGKREVYKLQIIDNLSENVKKALVIAGSDKRGTIYGLFRISELCGVSPLVYFGDVMPEKRDGIVISLDTPFVSKEPSVRYRGFFINDEWPAFGGWTKDTFGDVNAKAYDKVFEFLLRMKGNYLWPAMWNSSFSEDGPGLANAELADMYGVVMGTSHHEPLCRAGVEWQRQYKEYGDDNTWSFLSNEKAITKFWENGVLRNRDFENVYTIGMRGENDSKLLPEDAGIGDNIEVVKKAIRAQNAILSKYVDEDLSKVPRMLAIYKEVEDYYYGDDTVQGLKDWDELEDVIFLLSDDNHGNVRGLPDGDEVKHRGGFGMYYHFDYHGAPISYEWVNSNRLTKAWEQLTTAYEAGVRSMWIVNVGDIKNVEFPLTYFMELAYDHETWGRPDQTEVFVRKWVDMQFGGRLTDTQKEKLLVLIESATRLNYLRRQEHMNYGVFHPVHFREGERMLREINDTMKLAEELDSQLTGEVQLAYRSIFHYQIMASLNMMAAWTEAEINMELAKRGVVYANVLADSIKDRIKADPEYVREFHALANGKWTHMMDSAHTGFRSWDSRDWTYPVVSKVMPIPGGKILTGFRGSDKYHLGSHWQDRGPLENYDLMNPDTEEVLFDIDSRGDTAFSYEVKTDAPWLIIQNGEGRVDPAKNERATVSFRVSGESITGTADVDARVDVRFDNGEETHSDLRLHVAGKDRGLQLADGAMIKPEEGTFLETQGYCSFRAEHFTEKKDVDGAGFRVIEYLGREGAAVRPLPAMRYYPDPADAPYVNYRVCVRQSGRYSLVSYILSANPSKRGGRLDFAVSVNEGSPVKVHSVGEDYYAEWICDEWCGNVMNHARTVETDLELREGVNEIRIYAVDPGVSFEKFVLVPGERKLPTSYLGPQESPRM